MDLKKQITDSIKNFLAIVSLLLLSACSNSNNQKTEKTAETAVSANKYVYMDESGTLHTRLHCVAIGKEPGEFGGADRSVTRYLKENITASMLDYTCSRCVNDSMYEKLKEIAK